MLCVCVCVGRSVVYANNIVLYMSSCFIGFISPIKIPQICLYYFFITVISNLAASTSLLSYSFVDLKFNMGLTTQGIGRAMLLSGGFRERSPSLLTQVVDIMQVLGIVRLISPSLFWLPCRTFPASRGHPLSLAHVTFLPSSKPTMVSQVPPTLLNLSSFFFHSISYSI